MAKAMRGLVVMIALAGMLALSGAANAQVAIGISVGFAPPEIPVYEQPICPGEGYLWTPGYWAWDDDDGDYYWVPGTWVLAPEPGYLWTPGYWGWGGSGFFFHEGYWGPVIGFYGGINYGFGYFGRGYDGGRWERGHFFYNTTVNRVNVTEIHNVYNTRVDVRNETRVSYNGGNGGINVRASSREEAAARERHIGAVGAQHEHVQAARGNRELRASENHGRPPIAATSRPGAFSGGGVVAARSGGNYNPPPNRGGGNANRNDRSPNAGGRPENNASRTDRPPNAGGRAESNNSRPDRPPVHASDVPTYFRTDRPPSTGNPKVDQKYQQQQDKMYAKQQQEHQKLQQKQDQEHQRATQQRANDARQQQMEQRHQQQTQQLEQRHQQQQQKIEQRQQPRQQAPPRQSESKPRKP